MLSRVILMGVILVGVFCPVSMNFSLKSKGHERQSRDTHGENTAQTTHRVLRSSQDVNSVQHADSSLESIFGSKASQSMLTPQKGVKTSRRDVFHAPKAEFNVFRAPKAGFTRLQRSS